MRVLLYMGQEEWVIKDFLTGMIQPRMRKDDRVFLLPTEVRVFADHDH